MLDEINAQRKKLNAYYVGIRTMQGEIVSDGKRIWFSTTRGYYYTFNKMPSNGIVKILEAAKKGGWKWERLDPPFKTKEPPKINF